MNGLDETYSITQVSAMLSISQHNVRDYIKRGEIKANKENDIYCIPKTEYERFAHNYHTNKSVRVIVVLKGFTCSFYDVESKTKYGRILISTAITKFPVIEQMEVGRMYDVTLDAHELEHTRFDKGA